MHFRIIHYYNAEKSLKYQYKFRIKEVVLRKKWIANKNYIVSVRLLWYMPFKTSPLLLKNIHDPNTYVGWHDRQQNTSLTKLLGKYYIIIYSNNMPWKCSGTFQRYEVIVGYLKSYRYELIIKILNI